MSNIDKRVLRKAAEKTLNARARLALMQSVFDDDGDDVKPEAQEDISICVSFNDLTNPATVLALLDELEAAEERYEDMIRQARSFREAHDSASELIRKMERNKPTVKLPTTRLWAGKIACYEESEVVAMLERAGINIAAAGKGE
ncbi:Uncharacterised protein [Klebsiella pneumoniae]|nr:Uncharacterised protein [Klebsiella pneumoniae]